MGVVCSSFVFPGTSAAAHNNGVSVIARCPQGDS